MRTLLALLPALLLAAPADGATIEWAKTGGFAGVRQTVKVRSDRTVVVSGREGRISVRRYRRLRALLDDADFATLKPSYPAPGASDTFQYRVRWRGRTVRADQTKVPARLWPALRALQRVYDDFHYAGRSATASIYRP